MAACEREISWQITRRTRLCEQRDEDAPLGLVAGGAARQAGAEGAVAHHRRVALDGLQPLDGFAEALARLESRQVFGKIVVTL